MTRSQTGERSPLARDETDLTADQYSIAADPRVTEASDQLELVAVDSQVEDVAGATQQDPRAIRDEIAETRVELSGTLDAIGQKLDPGNLVSQAKENVRDATIGRVEEAVSTAGDRAKGMSEQMLETIRKNPVPAALTGIGLAWLWSRRAGGTGGTATRDRYAYGYPSAEPRSGYRYDPAGGYAGSGGIGEIGDRARGIAGSVAGTVGEKSGQVAGTVGDTAGQVAEAVGDTAGQIAGTVQQTAQGAFEQTRQLSSQARWQIEQILDENPLAVGAVAVAAGAAMGMLLPATRPEEQLLGEPSRQVTQAAQQAASEAMDKVKQVTASAQEAATEEARQQGLTG
ncbi:MAG: DUF3618 domain-containing protein [Chloroflexota bacterium]|nr:DUF3618 domain-containing protein [Chloroflexota bacterium]